MKKIFSYALLAAALLVGVNVNAANVAKVAIQGGATTEYATLAEAFGGIGVGETVTITMLDNAEISAELVVPEQAVITWDLAEKVVTINHQVKVIHTSLSIEGKGQITGYGWAEKYRMFYFEGSDTDNCGVYTYFKVGPDVSIECGDGYVMAINSSADPKHAFGLQIDIAGYLYAHAGPVNTPKGYTFAVVTINGGITDKTGTNLPEIWLRSTGTFLGDGMGIYGAGYAIWHIYGRCEGALGIYIKSGEWDIDGATIVANATSHDEVTTNSSGSSGGDGTGIVIDSHEGYGKIGDINIANSTVISNASDGYAIEEVATQGGTKLPDISIESGTFVGGITTTTEERQHIIDSGSITGGEWHNSDIDEYIDKDNYTTLDFVDGEGKQYQIVVPIKDSDWSTSIADAATKAEGLKYAKVAANEDVNTDTKVEFVRIQKNVVVTVKSGATLDAGTLMTEGPSTASPGGETGKIIVEAGGTLIVSGKQGAYTYNENSLVIEASETNSGIVLINPAVVLNTTPKATIEFISKAWRTDANHKVYQRFGLPTGYELSSIVCNTEGGYKTQLDYMDIVEGWVNAGVMESSASESILEKFNKPFIYCSMLSNNPSTTQMSYTFTGRLAGNTNATLEIRDQFMGYGNSYMGKLNINAMVSALDNLNGSVDATVYAYEDKGAGRMGWNGYGIVDLDLAEEEKNLNPMQPFMLYNKVSSSTPVILNYKDFVWKPVMGEEESSSAPRRASRQNMTAANIVLVNAEGLFDKATFAKSESFSSEYESGYDVVKYFDNEDNMSIYFSADQTLATIATNEAHAFVGVSVEKAGEYTIKFNKVRGENLELVDLNNNQHIAIAEGNEYSFYAEGSNDYRFEIIAGAQAPTAMDKVDAKANAVKVISNGEFRIVKDGRTYNAIGAEL